MHIGKRSVSSPVEIAVLHQIAILLIKGNFDFYLINQFLWKIVKIAFVSECSETGNRIARLHRSTPECLMIRACGYMRAHTLHRVTVGIALLDFRPADRVRIVGRPDLREVTEDSEIEPVAARRTSLKKNMRELFRQHIHNLVKAEYIAVCDFSLPCCKQGCIPCLCSGAGFLFATSNLSGLACRFTVRLIFLLRLRHPHRIYIREHAVHIPLHICDVSGGKNLTHRIDDKLAHFFSA